MALGRSAAHTQDISAALSVQVAWKLCLHTTGGVRVGGGVQCLCPNSPETPPTTVLNALQPRQAPPATPSKASSCGVNAPGGPQDHTKRVRAA